MRESSKEAFISFNSSNDKQDHYKIILHTLSKLKKAICREICDNCELTYHQIQRRMSELEKANKVEVIGRKLSVKYKPNIWKLVE